MALQYKGKSYELVEEATFSNRVFPGSWLNAEDGEAYTAEWQAEAIDQDGKECQVYFQFDEVKNQETEDASNYPWDSEHISKVVYF